METAQTAVKPIRQIEAGCGVNEHRRLWCRMAKTALRMQGCEPKRT